MELRVVLKIGGSLADYPKALEKLLRKIEELSVDHTILLVPGGGSFVEFIRRMQPKMGLDDEAAHWMAVRAQDMYGMTLSDTIPSAHLIANEMPESVMDILGTFILLPHNMMTCYDELPHNWDVTGDSIALWVGIKVKANIVVLLKSVDGIISTNQNGDEIILENVKADQLDTRDIKGVVDKYLANLVPAFNGKLYVMNGRTPQNLERLLTTRQCQGTEII